MPQNRYDDPGFFDKYAQMDRSQKGLAGAGEWPALQQLLPPLAGKRVLDLGCGYGWHCGYAASQGAAKAVGIDLSGKMLAVAREKNSAPGVEYRQGSIEEAVLEADSFDVAISSLALHYVADFAEVCRRVYAALASGGVFVFSVEHPIFTAYGSQDWLYGPDGEKLCWPVDRYFTEGRRDAVFLGEAVEKEHHTLTTYMGGVLAAGFAVTAVVEPQPTPEMLAAIPGMQEELRRPMMLLVRCQKP